MKKNIRFYVIMLVILVSAFSVIAFGSDDEPSGWALDEVSTANNLNLVDIELQKNYQQPITRGQYILLATKLYGLKGEDITIFNSNPFSDIDTYDYKNEIIAAYNIGIINGYGDGTYRPDQNISRQEMASLIVHMLKAIDSQKDYASIKTYEFVDFSEISKWAEAYISYCYENDIIKGVSTKDVRINPKGNATIEESIVLFYRLYNKLIAEDTISPSNEVPDLADQIDNINQIWDELEVYNDPSNLTQEDQELLDSIYNDNSENKLHN